MKIDIELVKKISELEDANWEIRSVSNTYEYISDKREYRDKVIVELRKKVKIA